jgi:tetratricopeptide (TPR) repeat protein
VDIHDRETVETPSPVRSRVGPLVGILVSLALTLVVAGAAVIAVSPGLTRRLFGSRGRTVAVRVTSTPEGADVFLDDEPAGRTPTRADVSPGLHRVRLVRHGYTPWHGVVDAEQEPDVTRTLEPLRLATLIVDSDPDRADVVVDGYYRGTTPLELTDMEAGHHDVCITKEPMYQSVAKGVELAVGETRRLVVPLESGLEGLYLSCIGKEPAKLSNYTELLHHYVLQGNAEKAVSVVLKAVGALKSAEPNPTELAQFYNEIRKILKGQAGTIDAGGRQKIGDSLLGLFERLVLAAPTEYRRYEPVVQLLGQAGRLQDIVKVCEKTVENKDACGLVHYYVANVYLNWGEPTSAIPLLERSVQLRPSLLSARIALGSAYHRADRYDDAMKQYEAAEKLVTESSPYYQAELQTHIARLLVSRKDVNGAIARYKKAIEYKNPPTYTCLWRSQLAELLLENGRKAEAIEQYREIVKLAPESDASSGARKALRRLEGK